MINFEYLLAHVVILHLVISSITAQPNCTEIEHPKNPNPHDTIGKREIPYHRYA